MQKLDKQTWQKLEQNYNKILMVADDICRDCKNPDFNIATYKMWIKLYVKEALHILEGYDYEDNYVMILHGYFELLDNDCYNLTAINGLAKLFGEDFPY